MPDRAEPTWGMGDALLATFVALLASSIIGGIALAAANTASSTDIPLWAVGLLEIPLWIGLLGVPLWATRRKGSGSLVEDFGLRMRWSDPFRGLAYGVAAQIVFVTVMPPLYRLVGIDSHKIGETADKLGDRATSFVSAVVLFVIVVVIAPVIEEIAYRGLWLRAAERRWGTVAGVVVSGVVFGVTHFQPYDTPILVAFGFVLGYLAARHRRLGPSIWAHVWFNLAAFIALVAK